MEQALAGPTGDPRWSSLGRTGSAWEGLTLEKVVEECEEEGAAETACDGLTPPHPPPFPIPLRC